MDPLSRRMAAALLGAWAALVLLNFPTAAPVPASVIPRWVAALSPVPGTPVPVPVDPAAFMGEWGRACEALLWAAALVVGACAMGRMGARLLPLRMPPAGWSALLGLVLGSGTVLGLGLAGLSFPAVLRVLLGVAVTGGAVRAIRSRDMAPVRFDGSPRWLHRSGLVVAGLYVAGALNPEPGIDAYVYHLRLPFIYALHHRVHSVWHHIHSHVPQLWELPLVAVPYLSAATCAQALSAACAWPVWRLFVGLAGGSDGARIAGLLLLSSPLVLGIGTSAYTDLPLVWVVLVAVSLLGVPSGRPSPARRVAAGMALGAASALKYAVFPAVAGSAVWLAVLAWRRRDWRLPLGAAAGFLAVFWPWPAWNGLAAGNPFTPFLGSWFPDALPALPFAERLSGAVFRRPWLGVLASPWNAFVSCEPFLFVSPVLVALAPAVVLARGAAPWPGAGLWLVVFLVCWARMIADERFGLAAVGLGAVWAARAGMFDRMAVARMGRWAFAAALALNVAGVVRQMWLPPARIAVALGLASREAYWKATLPPAPGYGDAASWLNAHSGVSDRVLFVSECRSHLLWREAVHDHVIDYPTRLVWILQGSPSAPSRIAARFRQLGISWVLYLPGRASARLRDMPDLMPFSPPMAKSWGEFWVSHARPAWRGHEASVYRLSPGAGPASDLPDLPGVQDVMLASAKETWRRSGPEAALADLRAYATAFSRIGGVHRMLGEALGSLGAANRPESIRHLGVANRIDAASGGVP